LNRKSIFGQAPSHDVSKVERTRASYQLIYITVTAINANVTGGSKNQVGGKLGRKEIHAVWKIFVLALFILNFTSAKNLAGKAK